MLKFRVQLAMLRAPITCLCSCRLEHVHLIAADSRPDGCSLSQLTSPSSLQSLASVTSLHRHSLAPRPCSFTPILHQRYPFSCRTCGEQSSLPCSDPYQQLSSLSSPVPALRSLQTWTTARILSR